MDVLSAPTLADTFTFLDERLRGGQPPSGLLAIVGRCRVDYRGRALSRLDEGDRLIMVKRDGSLLIHGPTGFKPINWQPPGARFEVMLHEGSLTLWARRTKPPEVVEVQFAQVAMCWLGRLEDAAPLQLSGTEFDLRDLLRSKPELVERGFKPWERERITDQGPMDLYGEDSAGRRVVVEVKRTAAGLAEATQLWRYVEAERKRRQQGVRGILIAPKISPRALQLLHEHGLEFLARHWEDSRSVAARAASGPRQPRLSAFADPPRTGKS
ncbi:MAG TPA: endonuclease NucS [Candidatus Thermoplasmatota archaeon]|nr:endonuclease NucS [Candidatus Thermoplasmatota archaeon]